MHHSKLTNIFVTSLSNIRPSFLLQSILAREWLIWYTSIVLYSTLSVSYRYIIIILQCTVGTVCKKTCAGDELDCYILDDNGFIILSEDVSQTGRFFGQVDGTIMDSLVQDRIYKKVVVHDHQGRCPDSRNPFSGNGNKLTVNIFFFYRKSSV